MLPSIGHEESLNGLIIVQHKQIISYGVQRHEVSSKSCHSAAVLVIPPIGCVHSYTKALI